MGFCPFMSSLDVKVECDKECQLFIPKTSGWKLYDRPWEGCAIVKTSINLECSIKDSNRIKVILGN